MTSTLPDEIRSVFDRFITTEYVTIDARGQPIAWPVTPYHHPEHGCVDVSTGIGYPKKAHDAERNPQVALLFSDPTGSGLGDPPTVLVQGIAHVDGDDLHANRARYARESAEKLPGTLQGGVPEEMVRTMDWYMMRLYVHVRPERVYAWHGGPADEPVLYDAHLEEVRSGHSEEPEAPHAGADGGATAWDERVEELGGAYVTAVLAIVGPDGFPFAVRTPVSADAAQRRIRLVDPPLGTPLTPGLACLTAHAHDERLRWERNFQVRGDLVEDEDGWALVPHRLVGGFELPPVSTEERLEINRAKIKRFRRTAEAELERRQANGSGAA